MADITKNDSQILQVSLGDTINDWRTLTNDQIIAKLNLMKVYDISAGTGLSAIGGFAGGGSGGTYEMEVSDTIAKNITIDGNLDVTGNVSFSTAGEVSFPNGLVNVNGDDTPVAGDATGGIVVGSYTGPDFNTGTIAPFFLNNGGSWFTNQDLKMIGGGTLANASMQQILFGEANGKTLSFKQNVTDLIIGNGHALDVIPVGTTLSGEIARIRSEDGRVDILRGVNKRRVSGVSHDFDFGQVVRASSADANGFTLAFGGGGSTLAEAVGMISRRNGDSDFEVTFNGEVEGNFTTVSGGVLSVGCPYFLSPIVAGRISTVEPNTPGHVSKPVLIGLSSDRGLFVNYRGQEVNSFQSSGSVSGSSGGRSIRIPNTGFNVGDLVGINDSGSYIKLSTANDGSSNAARTLGLVVNDSEILLYGVTEPTDQFTPSNHILNFSGSSEKLFYSSYTQGQLDMEPESPAIPMGVILGASNQIFFFNTRPGQGYQGTDESSANNSSGTNSSSTNILVNGGFDVWQRGIGVDSGYTGQEDTYFADRWFRTKQLTAPVWSGTELEIQRLTFPEGQTDVKGNPKYYSKFITSIRPGAGETPGDHISFNTVIEDANTLADQSVVVSFYARGATGVTGHLALEYTQYWEGTVGGTFTNQILPRIYLDGEYKWKRHSVIFSPKTGPTASGLINRDESFSKLSIFPYRFNNITGDSNNSDVIFTPSSSSLTTNVEFSIAQFQMTAGFAVTDPLPIDIDQELKRCYRFYQTSYEISDYVAKPTMVGFGNFQQPKDSTPNIMMAFGASRTSIRLPVSMRKTPTLRRLYSPTGVLNMPFNVSANLDFSQVSSTEGFAGAQRESPTSSGSVSLFSDSPQSFAFNATQGWVFGDTVAFHYVLGSEFNTGVAP